MSTTDEFPERAECDFSLPHDYDCRGRTQCAHCNVVVLQASATIVTYSLGRSSLQEHFCGELCASEFALEKLRGEEQ